MEDGKSRVGYWSRFPKLFLGAVECKADKPIVVWENGVDGCTTIYPEQPYQFALSILPALDSFFLYLFPIFYIYLRRYCVKGAAKKRGGRHLLFKRPLSFSLLICMVQIVSVMAQWGLSKPLMKNSKSTSQTPKRGPVIMIQGILIPVSLILQVSLNPYHYYNHVDSSKRGCSWQLPFKIGREKSRPRYTRSSQAYPPPQDWAGQLPPNSGAQHVDPDAISMNSERTLTSENDQDAAPTNYYLTANSSTVVSSVYSRSLPNVQDEAGLPIYGSGFRPGDSDQGSVLSGASSEPGGVNVTLGLR